VVSGLSENGTFLGRIVLSSEAKGTAVISNLTKAWIRETFMEFHAFAQEHAFFWAWAPASAPDEVAYVWLENSPNPSFDLDGYVSIELQMAGLLE
jgi:hypothetical protein